MKTKIILSFLFMISMNIMAQEINFQKVNIKFYYSPILYGKNSTKNFYYNLWGFNPNYKISELWETGCFSSYTKTMVATSIIGVSENMYSTLFESSGTFIFGLNGNFHILPLFTKTNNLRYDLYLTGKIGGFYIIKQNLDYPKGINPEYSIGTGFSVNFSKHFGIFSEYNYGKLISFNHRWEYGIEIMF